MRTLSIIAAILILASVATATMQSDTDALIQKFTESADNEFSASAAVMSQLAAQGGISRLLELLEDTIAQLQDAKRISAKAASSEDARIQGVVAGLDQDIVNMDSDLTQKQARLVASQSAFEAAVADEGTREQNKVALTTQGKTLTRGCAASAAAHQTKVNQYQRVSSEADQMRALLVRVRDMVTNAGVKYVEVSSMIQEEAEEMQTAEIKTLAKSAAAVVALMEGEHRDEPGAAANVRAMFKLIDDMIAKIDAQKNIAQSDLAKERTFYATVTKSCQDQQAQLEIAMRNNDQALATAKANIAAANVRIAQVLAQINTVKANRVSKVAQKASTQTQRDVQRQSEVTKQTNYDAQIKAIQAIIDHIKGNRAEFDKQKDSLDPVDVALPGQYVLGPWSTCSAGCGNGQQSRTVSCKGGLCPKPAPLTSQACKVRECPVNCVMSAWSSWSICDKQCGTGSQTQTRSVMTPAAFGGTPCPSNLQQVQPCSRAPCPVDCQVSDWSAPSACSKTCGGGESTQTRSVLRRSDHGGAVCPVLTRSVACNTGACPTPRPGPVTTGCAAGQACIAEHCDNTGWKQGITLTNGLLINAGAAYKADASYITMPAGWRAVLKGSNGVTQTVEPGTTFEFCSKGGFNDGTVSMTFTSSSSSSSARCSAMRQIPNSNIPYPYCPPSVRQYPGQPGRCWVTSLEAAQAQCNADVACCGITKDAMGWEMRMATPGKTCAQSVEGWNGFTSWGCGW